ncbi:hypothetical protein SAMN05421504_107411 [Amycolatopsis xylanica]|uniref:DUF6545 domain-containing protein n=1 Tax=Amycolatopsis xylanica TaxID=589385 RepID=A0A1H3NQM7_9PSEU|nr:MAB_1171c family putative transporter [Amycolatopsis xylanica]SDY91108.1 hypothetical protein SAMN05421504_107411 [Amycolatopsis xylanica]
MITGLLTTLEVATVVGLWTAGLIRVPSAIRSRRARLWAATLFLEALSMTFAQPAIGRWVNAFTGVPNVESLLKHGLTALFDAAILHIMLVVVGRDSRVNRRRVLISALVTVTAMTVLFGFATSSAGAYFLPKTVSFSPLISYWLVYLSYVCAISTIAMWVFWRYNLRAGSRLLRISLKLITVCFVAGIAYAVLRTVLLFYPETPIVAAMRLIMYIGLLAFVAGSILSAYPDYAQTARSYCALWTLYPLWRAVYEAVPHIALITPRGRVRELAFGSLNLRLYRRVIEIRDGLITLRDYLPASVLDQARARAGGRNALATACSVAVACRLKLRGAEPCDDPATDLFNGAELPDRAAEIQWLCEVSRAYGSAAVREFAAAESGQAQGVVSGTAG